MSNKYKTGIYILTLFDRYGTKLDSLLRTEGGLIAAQIEGERLVEEMDECASFVIQRVVHNSLDPK